jgi:hypothetical protein
MMLVISVIVALAILAVLMNIIGGIGVVGGGAPDTLMHDQLKDVVSKGYGYSGAKKAVFAEGTIITTDQVILPDITSVQPNEIAFLLPAGDDPLKDAFEGGGAAGEKLIVKRKVEANFVICGKATTPQTYVISLARTATDAAKNCIIPTT